MELSFSLLVPSRARPDRFRQMLESALGTASRPDQVRIELLVDPDEPRLVEYEALARQYFSIRMHQPPERLLVPAAFQYLAERARGDILMLASDDVLFRTPGWDQKVRGAFDRYADGLALVYPSDGHGNGRQGDVKGNHWFVTRRWVDVVGCFCPVSFEHFCCDTVPEKIAAAAGRFVHLPEVLVEHMHFKYGQSQRDDTYAYTRTKDASGLSMSQRDEAKMAAMAPWIADRAAAVRNAIARAA